MYIDNFYFYVDLFEKYPNLKKLSPSKLIHIATVCSYAMQFVQ